ncbi:MAG TPA: HAD family hydrolase [Candidatus Solibacter sp.]|nr:HAD family hydrolase [Candidatus Solibacter sp.]
MVTSADQAADVGLVIFDCDGVLVDSEILGNSVLVQVITELGLEISLEESLTQFRGGKMADVVTEIERRLGRPVPPGFVADFRARSAAAFRRELRAVPDIEDALDQIPVPMCVASSGPPEKIQLTLELTGLLPRFTGRIFSAYEVGIWKPDPGLFLHAASAMGVPPHNCTVVEDSVLGVRAGVAAGMRVLGFAAIEQEVVPLAEAGATPFRSMRDLPRLLAVSC